MNTQQHTQPHVPFARFRTTPWVITFCILGAVGMLAGWILLAG